MEGFDHYILYNVTNLHPQVFRLSIKSNPLNLFVTCTVNFKGFDLGHICWSSGFSYCPQFKYEFFNKEFMIWATVSSQSCFCWLYTASPSLAAGNIINLILLLTIWWCPYVESSLELEEGVCYDQCILLAKPYYPLPCFILYSKAKFACCSRYFFTSYFCILVPYNEKDIFFGC